MTTTQLTLPPQPVSVSQARRFVVDVLLDLDVEDACDDAAMLVSELATNAVLHARTEFTIEVALEAGTLRIGVLDLSAAVPRVRHYGGDATTGRGMRLVESMSSAWGIVPSQDGKLVWFELPAQGSREQAWADDVDPELLLAAFAEQDEQNEQGEPDGDVHEEAPRVLGRAA